VSLEKELEKQRRRAVENAARDFTSGNQAEWATMDERSVVKALRLWVLGNGYRGDLSIWVDPLAESRYWLVPAWSLEKWVRDSRNVYTYPLEEGT
jgi:hypothetical protein